MSKLAVSLQPASPLSPPFSPPHQHLASLQPTIILALKLRPPDHLAISNNTYPNPETYFVVWFMHRRKVRHVKIHFSNNTTQKKKSHSLPPLIRTPRASSTPLHRSASSGELFSPRPLLLLLLRAPLGPRWRRRLPNLAHGSGPLDPGGGSPRSRRRRMAAASPPELAPGGPSPSSSARPLDPDGGGGSPSSHAGAALNPSDGSPQIPMAAAPQGS